MDMVASKATQLTCLFTINTAAVLGYEGGHFVEFDEPDPEILTWH